MDASKQKSAATSNGYVSREDFWKFSDVIYAEEQFPGWPGKIRIRSLSDKDQRELELESLGFDEDGNPKQEGSYQFARRAIAQIVDWDDEPMFGNVDLERLASMRFSVTGPIFRWMRDFARTAGSSIEDEKKS